MYRGDWKWSQKPPMEEAFGVLKEEVPTTSMHFLDTDFYRDKT